MTDKVLEIRECLEQEPEAKWVVDYWDRWNQQRSGKMAEWAELRKFLFATDTTTTSVSTLPWKNTTTIPKLCQIRDNLFSNYISALFPNDKWLRWEGGDSKSVSKEKAEVIQAYMQNKIIRGNLRTTVGELLYDYIDYGNSFAMPIFEERYITKNGESIADFIGPKAVRISPEDIVFNPLASDFAYTPKIVRSIKTIGELKKISMISPDLAFWSDVVDKRLKNRLIFSQYGIDDVNKASQYSVDGFGNLWEYYMSDYVEILEFYGDYHNITKNELETSRVVTIVDRSCVVRNEPINTYSGRAPIYHVGWRARQGNLWAMGPLDNLVGMQYRLDHLQNSKADAIDLAIAPPLVIAGEVEAFVWGPNQEIHIDENGSVSELGQNLNNVIAAQTEMRDIEDHMELYAGAPREAMGIRTPGEKTAFEVQQLFNAAGRIFQEKIVNFEVNLMEPLLNGMLEEAHRNFNGRDIIAVIDKDFGVRRFEEITKEDIIANGVIRPIGARYFAQRAQELQDLTSIFNSPLRDLLAPHVSAINLAQYISNSLGISGYDIFIPNIAVHEQADTQRELNQSAEDQQVESMIRSDGSIMGV